MRSSQTVLEVNNLSKRYRIGSPETQSSSRIQALSKAILSPYHRYHELRRLSNFNDNDDKSLIWALRDISFRISQGEVVGIMGANGAGKSTLLKILSRIVMPTSGSFSYRGVLASLLEVGTGFNGELTGRENIYLNGAILGLKRKAIEKVFDEIVDFSGVERFIDTPVKKYSSGMTVRLAFSVAAHLNADILILDEVLSVGDAQFSAKSMQKMENVARDGKTVIFVSHSTTAVAKLCHRAIFLSAGQITAQGDVEEIAGIYLGNTIHTRTSVQWNESLAPRAEGLLRLISTRLIDRENKGFDSISINQDFGLEVTFEVFRDDLQILCEFQIVNDQGQILFTSIERHAVWSVNPRSKGLHSTTAWVPGNLLPEGRFSINIAFSSTSPRDTYLRETEVIYFYVRDPLTGGTVRYDYGTTVPGMMRPRLEWTSVNA